MRSPRSFCDHLNHPSVLLDKCSNMGIKSLVKEVQEMQLLLGVIIWVVLFLVWPLAAIGVLIVYPVAWLICLPFKLMGICVEAGFALLEGLLFLPARLVGMRAI